MLRYFLTAIAIATLTSPAIGAAAIGAPAPDFAATDSNGKNVRLADFRGKTVVLEWTSPECPFVEKHYTSGNLQRQQQDAQNKGVIWLMVNSSASGKQGHVSGAEANAAIRSEVARLYAYLIDDKGEMGRAYGARFAPQMFVIDAKGILAYAGGVDDVPSANPADIAKAEQLVSRALDEILSGKEVSKPTSRAYGCSIRY